ncbi:MAG: hypothetical protein OEY33_06915 [Bdellovibrionales bacterium]|nr:hypothetical protein [Bdellovibrionales bacterium]
MKNNILIHQSFILIIILAIITYLVFRDSLQYPFFIFGDAEILDKFGPNESLFDLKRPLIVSDFKSFFGSIMWSIIGKYTSNPGSFRILNILFHFLNSILVYRLINFTNKNNNTYIPLFCSLLFLIYPINIQSVIWISALPTILALFFVLLSTYFYLKSSDDKVDFWIILSTLCFLFSIMNSKSPFFIPILYFFYDFFKRKSSIKIITLKSLFFTPSIWFIFNYWYGFVPVNKTSLSFIDKINVFKFSFFKLFLPLNTSIDYQIDDVNPIEVTIFIFGLFSILLLFLKNKKWSFIGVAISFICLSLLPFFDVKTSDIHLYSASIGVIYLLNGVLMLITVNNNNLKYKATLLSIFMLFLVFKQQQKIMKHWITSESQLLYSYSNNQESYVLNMALGALYKSKSEYMRSLYHFNKAREINPRSVMAKHETIEGYKKFNPSDGYDMANIDFFFNDLAKSLNKN